VSGANNSVWRAANLIAAESVSVAVPEVGSPRMSGHSRVDDVRQVLAEPGPMRNRRGGPPSIRLDPAQFEPKRTKKVGSPNACDLSSVTGLLQIR